MFYYHFTNKNYLKNIYLDGLVPKNGYFSKLVGDKRVGICFSKDIPGCVAFSARFWYKMMFIYNDESVAREKFNNTVFLRFKCDIIDLKECILENFSQLFFKKSISADVLRICYLEDSKGTKIFDRFLIMLYMMKTVEHPNEMDLDDFPYKALVEKIYKDLKEDLENFNEKDYKLNDMILEDYIKNIDERLTR